MKKLHVAFLTMSIAMIAQTVMAQKMDFFYLQDLGVIPFDGKILLSSTVNSTTTGFSVIAPSAVRGVLTKLSVEVDGLLGDQKVGYTLPELSLQHVPLIIPGYLQTSYGASTKALNSVSIFADAMYTGFPGYFIGVAFQSESYYAVDSTLLGRGDLRHSTHLYSYIAGHFLGKKLLVNVRFASDLIDNTKWIIDLEESEFKIESKIEGSSLYLGVKISGSGSERNLVFSYSM